MTPRFPTFNILKVLFHNKGDQLLCFIQVQYKTLLYLTYGKYGHLRYQIAFFIIAVSIKHDLGQALPLIHVPDKGRYRFVFIKKSACDIHSFA